MTRTRWLTTVFVLGLVGRSWCSSAHLHSTVPAWSSLVENVTTSQFSRMVLPQFIDFTRILTNDHISAGCRGQLQHALQALEVPRQWWAFSLFNSWGKFLPSGATRGTFTDYGDYDQCLSVQEPVTAKYCLVDIALPMPSPVPRDVNYFHHTTVLSPSALENSTSVFAKFSEHSTLFYYNKIENGICLPSVCTVDDIKSFLSNELTPSGLKVSRVECHEKTPPLSLWSLNKVQLFALCFFVSMYALTLYAAIYDRYYNKGSIRTNPTVRGDTLLWFSPLRNIRKLLHISKNEDELRAIHGLRFMTMCWIIIGHALDWNPLEMLRDNFLMRDRLANLLLQPLYKGFNSVETFFFISGLLTSIMVLRNTHGKLRAFKWGPFLYLRYLRLTPQLIVYFLGTSLVPLLMNGPVWKRLTNKIDRCYTHSWINLVYLQNFIDVKNICELQTWYLAVDMQMHFVSLVPVVILLRYGRYWATVTSAAIVMVSVCVSATTIWLEQFPPGSVYTWRSIYYTATGQMGEFHERFLYFPWNHSILFIGGLVFGMYLSGSNQNKKNKPLPVLTKYIHWLGVLGLYLFCIFCTAPYLWGAQFNGGISAILFPSQQAAWAVMLAWLIWLCSSGNGGAFGRIVCWRGWQPLSRLTYSVYLSHGWVLYLSLGSLRTLLDYHPVQVTFWTTGLILTSYCVGFTFGIVFETPLINFLEEMKHRFIRLPPHSETPPPHYEMPDTAQFLEKKPEKLPKH